MRSFVFFWEVIRLIHIAIQVALRDRFICGIYIFTLFTAIYIDHAQGVHLILKLRAAGMKKNVHQTWNETLSLQYFSDDISSCTLGQRTI